MNEIELRTAVDELRRLPSDRLEEHLRALLPPLSLRDRFELLHRLGIYHHPESMSGAASTLSETTALRNALPDLLRVYRVATVLDIPCGDFHWMKEVPMTADYVGGDIVPQLVERNQQLYGGRSRRFRVLDATRDALPQVDLVVCRDLLIHLSNSDCLAVLSNIRASGSRLLLTNHFATRDRNVDTLSGDFRPVNLCAEPFLLPPPQLIVNEESELADGAFTDRSMALWPVTDLPALPSRTEVG
jgi:hypothetical protein